MSASCGCGDAGEDTPRVVVEQVGSGGRVEAELVERGVGAEILCFAVSGYNARQSVEMLATRGLAYVPDLVLFAYVLNDHLPPEAEILRALRAEAEGSVAVRPDRLAPLRRSATYRFFRYRVLGGGQATEELLPLEEVDHGLHTFWPGLLVPGRRLGLAFLSLLALRPLQEGVLRELLLDPLLEIEGRQLQDLHGLDHLRRLEESLLEPGGLMEA